MAKAKKLRLENLAWILLLLTWQVQAGLCPYTGCTLRGSQLAWKTQHTNDQNAFLSRIDVAWREYADGPNLGISAIRMYFSNGDNFYDAYAYDYVTEHSTVTYFSNEPWAKVCSTKTEYPGGWASLF